MLLQLQQANNDNLEKLMDYAKQNNIELSVIDNIEENYSMPGKPLSKQTIKLIISKGRTNGTILMENVHNAIRKNNHAD